MRFAFALALGMAVFSGCAHKRTARRLPAPPPPAATARTTTPVGNHRTPDIPRTSPGTAPLAVETGIASWYGHPYHGRAAANGEIYDMEKLTAAHRTLPFDTWVHVVNLTNDKTVDVRITDRGPFVDGRIIDLSHAAAREIALIGPGTANVRLEILSIPENAPTGAYAVQVGVFRDKENAERKRARLAGKYGSARLILRAGPPSVWRVVVGSEKTEDGADALRQKIRKDFGERNAFVVRLES